MAKIRRHHTTPDQNPKRFWDLYEHGVTQGLLGRFLQCPERHRLAMVEGVQTLRTGGALAFGNLVHEALSIICGHQFAEDLSPDDIVDTVLTELEKRDRAKLRETLNKSPEAEQDMELNFGFADRILKAYFRQWSSDPKDFNWQGLEEVFCFDFNPESCGLHGRKAIPVRGKFDGYFLARDGGLWLFETKTKSRIEEDSITDKLSYDLQVLLYMVALEELTGKTPKGVVYNLIRRPQLKQGVKESFKQFLNRVEEDIRSRPDFYFIRYHVQILAEERRRWWKEFCGVMRALISWNEGEWHYRDSGACTGRQGNCEYLPLCGREDRTNLIRREEVFPELVEGGDS